MSKEELLEGLRHLERREKPGTAMAQLREIEAEITALLGKGYTLQQVWRCLCERGLKLTFSGFKSSFYRLRKEAGEFQKASNGFEECPHCGGALTAGGSRVGIEEEPATDSQPEITAEGEYSGKALVSESMGSAFARALEKGMLPTPLGLRRSKP